MARSDAIVRVPVGAGFRFPFAFTMDDIELLEDLRTPHHPASTRADVL